MKIASDFRYSAREALRGKWLTPYRQAAEAAFCREISGTEKAERMDNQ